MLRGGARGAGGRAGRLLCPVCSLVTPLVLEAGALFCGCEQRAREACAVRLAPLRDRRRRALRALRALRAAQHQPALRGLEVRLLQEGLAPRVTEAGAASRGSTAPHGRAAARRAHHAACEVREQPSVRGVLHAPLPRRALVERAPSRPTASSSSSVAGVGDGAAAAPPAAARSWVGECSSLPLELASIANESSSASASCPSPPLPALGDEPAEAPSLGPGARAGFSAGPSP